MYISLYRRYRPQKFSDMVGQSAAVSVLGESLKEGHLGHAYLLSGPRGCGKTSAARIVAKSLICLNPTEDREPCGICSNCNAVASGEHLDVIEIDGASNRGIGEIRDLKSHVNLKPLSADYKVYIIDEVHMLTEPAFNALLKTLEEPPANVVFLLATTEPHKVPVTIRSRCQHIPFHRISIEDMVKRLMYICECENVKADTEAVWEISRQADGALRDALSLTEQALVLGKGSLTMDIIKDLTGGSNRAELERWITSLRTEPQKAASDLHLILARGISPERLTESLFAVFRDLWIFSMWGEKGISALEISDSELAYLKSESDGWDKERLKAACLLCNRLLPRTRYGMKQEVFSGLLLIELLNISAGENIDKDQIMPASSSLMPKAAGIKKEMPASLGVDETVPFPSLKKQSLPENKQWQPDMNQHHAYIPDASAAVSGGNRPLSEDIGDTDFSRLLSKLGEKSLPIGAALLNCEIVNGEDGWDLVFNGPSPSESYLMIPQNRKCLASAIFDIWGIKNSAEPEASEQDTLKPPVINGPDAIKNTEDAVKNNSTKQENVNGSLVNGSPADRIIKLLGAELLYVKDNSADSDDIPIEFNE